MEKELLRICMCILGAVSLYLGIVALFNDMGGVFFIVLPLNALFIYWYSRRVRRA